MMKRFSCRDAGVHDCDWMVLGDDEDQVVARVREHDEASHPRHPLKDNERAIRRTIQDV